MAKNNLDSFPVSYFNIIQYENAGVQVGDVNKVGEEEFYEGKISIS